MEDDALPDGTHTHEPPAALEPLGLTDRWRALFAEAVESVAARGEQAPRRIVLGRVARVDRGGAVALIPEAIRAEPAWHLAKSSDPTEMPTVGDWVAVNDDPSLDMAQIEMVLPRSSAFVRRDPGREAGGQVVAANIDTVFVVHALSAEPNLGRIERELALTWESGASPAIVLTKSDVCEADEEYREQVEGIALGVPVHVTSAVTESGIEELRAYAAGGRTVALIGPSGVGKSTLVNLLIGEERQETREVRATDHKGRHTTIARELIPIPGGGILVDTPGMRGIAMWDAEEGIAQAFADVEELAVDCRFRDCAHESEPGCAVRAAVEAGEVPERRLDSYRKLRAELVHLAEQQDVRARLDKRQHDKTMGKAIKAYFKQHPGKK